MRKTKMLSILVVFMMVLGTASAVLAQDPVPPLQVNGGDAKTGPTVEGNGPDPNYVPTAKELETLDAKEALLKQHMQQRAVEPNNYGYHIVYVGEWHEPNLPQYDNYCGPGATQVALDARLDASQVPDIDTIGAEEHVNEGIAGVYTWRIRDTLNYHLNDTWYGVSPAGSALELWNRIVVNIDNGYAPITSLKTGGMPGWGTKNVAHIVAMYGYNQGSTNWVYYTETSSQHAGFNGTYRNSQTRDIFYGYVHDNDSTVW